MDEGEIEIDSIEAIGFPDITSELARESGFLGILDLLKVAKHGRGENIDLVRFHHPGDQAQIGCLLGCDPFREKGQALGLLETNQAGKKRFFASTLVYMRS